MCDAVKIKWLQPHLATTSISNKKQIKTWKKAQDIKKSDTSQGYFIEQIQRVNNRLQSVCVVGQLMPAVREQFTKDQSDFPF